MQWVIYLALAAVGFYFGKWLGAIGLIAIYIYFSQKKPLNKPRQSSSAQSPVQQQSIAWAYQELGVSQHADSTVIEKARKRLLNHYHPDKLGTASDAEKQAAEQKVNAINQAYAAIKQHKGL